MDDGTFKQARTVAATARVGQDRDTKFSAGFGVGIAHQGEVGHGNDGEVAVEDAVDFVAFKVQAVAVAMDVFVAGGIPKAQVSVVRSEGQ